MNQTYQDRVVPRKRAAVSAVVGLSAVRRLVACVLAISATGGLAKEPFALGGHALGQRADTVMADPQYDCGGLSGCFLFEACTYLESGHGEFMNVPIDGLTLYITGERISGIEASFAEPEFERVLAALQKEYGTGEAADGATPGNVVRIWRNGSRVLRIERLLRPDRSSVIVAERNILSELTGR